MKEELSLIGGDKEKQKGSKKPYVKPAIIYEQLLETKAGSPIPGNIDPLNLGSP